MISASDRRRIIVFFHTGHPNHVGILKYIRPSLVARGYKCEEVSFRDPSAFLLLADLLTKRDQIFCLYSVNLYITELSLRNRWLVDHTELKQTDGFELYIHQLTGIPLVLHIYDHPLYLLKYESSALDGSLVFVNGTDMIDFMQKHFRSECNYIPIPKDARLPELAGTSSTPDIDNFLARRNEIFCPMNLSVQNMTVDGHWNRITDLPPTRRNRARRLVDAALYDCVTPLHLVSERLTAAGDPEIELTDQLHVLNFIKLWRRTEIVRALIELPILVSTDFVPADLSRKYPSRFTTTSMAETLTLYKDFRFALNSFPLVADSLHDRIYNPLFANSVLISDRNALATQIFKDGFDLLFLDYNGSDMAAKIRPYLEAPHLAFQITLTSYERRIVYQQGLPNVALCDTLIDAVRAKWNEQGTRSSVAADRTLRAQELQSSEIT